MKTYLIDTEFIRASKERVHFIEVACLDLETKVMYDYHFPPNLNNWERKYFDRALSGYYGERTTKVFEAVNDLVNGNFDSEYVSDLCNIRNVEYECHQRRKVKNISRFLSNTRLLAWDTSNDRELLKQIDSINIELVDVQSLWVKKFGGRQIALGDAYKHVLYNQGLKDTDDLLVNAHYACADVLLLESVYNFILNYECELLQIPIYYKERDVQVEKNKNHIDNWLQAIKSLEEEMANCLDQEVLKKASKKIIRCKQKIAGANKRNQLLLEREVYENKWW